MSEEWIGYQDRFSSFDGTKIHYRRISPRKGTCYTALLIHGLGEHAGRYNNLYHHFVPRGYEFFAPDLRGHGLSEGKRGHIFSFDEFTRDIDYLRQKIGSAKPGTCTLEGGADLLIGHSMGGLIALRYALDHQDEFRAVIVTGPLLDIAVKVPAWQESMGKIMSKIAPKFTMGNGLDPNGLSRNPAVVKAYIDDPLVHDRVSARWFTEITATMDYVHANAGKLKIPILIMHGSADSLAGPKGSEKFIANCGSADKELKIYDGAFHELYNETNYREVLDYLEAWLKKRNM